MFRMAAIGFAFAFCVCVCVHACACIVYKSVSMCIKLVSIFIFQYLSFEWFSLCFSTALSYVANHYMNTHALFLWHDSLSHIV